MKRALVCGASGLIGSHLVNRLKADDYYVIGVSRERPKETQADKYVEADLRDMSPIDSLFEDIHEIYQLACEVGGLGYIADAKNDVEMLRNSTQIDLAVLEACRLMPVYGWLPPKVFFASSACVYNKSNQRFYAEIDAYPASCANEFAWQKLFAEHLYQAYARCYGFDIRIGRLFNTYGIGMAWRGGREKSVAALCRKIAEAEDGGVIDVWGSGEQTRSYMHVDDAVEGIRRMMTCSSPNWTMPVNIGPAQEVTIRDLVRQIEKVASKNVFCRFGQGETGVSRICSDNKWIRERLHWEPSITIEEGLKTVYPWVEKQVLDARAKT